MPWRVEIRTLAKGMIARNATERVGSDRNMNFNEGHSQMKTSTSLFAKLLGRAKCRAHYVTKISLCVFKGQNGSMLTDTGMNIRRTFNPRQAQ